MRKRLEEFSLLGDRRLQKGLFELATSFFARSVATMPQAVSTVAAKAAYSLFDHERTTLEALIATLDRLRHEAIRIIVDNTLSPDFTTLAVPRRASSPSGIARATCQRICKTPCSRRVISHPRQGVRGAAMVASNQVHERRRSDRALG
jgi:hypothetical protein